MLKLIVAWPASWLAFIFGAVCGVMSEFGEGWKYWVAFWYPMYNDLMIGSLVIQDWAGGEEPYFPWGKVRK